MTFDVRAGGDEYQRESRKDRREHREQVERQWRGRRLQQDFGPDRPRPFDGPGHERRERVFVPARL